MTLASLELLDQKFEEQTSNALLPFLLRHKITVEQFLSDLQNDNILQKGVVDDVKCRRAFKRRFPEDVVRVDYWSFAESVSLIQDQGNGGGRNGGKGEQLLRLTPAFERPHQKGDLTLKEDVSRNIQVKHGKARINDGTVTCVTFKEKLNAIAKKHGLTLSRELEDIPNFLPEHKNGLVKKNAKSTEALTGERNFAVLNEQVSRSNNPGSCWLDIVGAMFSRQRKVLTPESIANCLDHHHYADPSRLSELVKDAMCPEEDEELLFFSQNSLSYAPSLKEGLNFVSLHMRRGAQEVVRVYVEPKIT